jgi:hypothetical protein
VEPIRSDEQAGMERRIELGAAFSSRLQRLVVPDGNFDS